MLKLNSPIVPKIKNDAVLIRQIRSILIISLENKKCLVLAALSISFAYY